MTQRIFVSYSHADKRWLDEFRIALAPVVREGDWEIWDDTRIGPGKNWRNEIESAIESCTAALLLASPTFLASSFIVDDELPAILNRANNGGLKVFWACVSACLADKTKLMDYQALHDVKRPLDQLRRSQLHQTLAGMAKRMDEELRKGGSSGRGTAQESGTGSADLGPEIELDLTIMPLAAAALPAANLTRGQFVNLLKAELISHPILTKIDYESVPRALTSKLFIVVTKSGRNLAVTHIGVEAMPVAAVEAWQQLCSQHFEAYKLPFRLDYNALLNAAEYQRSERVVGALVTCLHRYYASILMNGEFGLVEEIHRLTRDVSLNLERAAQKYARFENDGDERALGEVAIELDSAISAVHKLALAWRLNG